MARKLAEMGITRVRPLLGGFDAWRDRGYLLQAIHDQEGQAVGR